MLASDSTLWCSLLRRRHGEPLGDADPCQTLLPSVRTAERKLAPRRCKSRCAGRSSSERM